MGGQPLRQIGQFSLTLLLSAQGARRMRARSAVLASKRAFTSLIRCRVCAGLPSAPAGAPTGDAVGRRAGPALLRQRRGGVRQRLAGLLLPGGGLLLLLRQLVAAGQPLELLLLALLLGQQGFSSSVSTCKLSCSACCWASVNRTMPAAWASNSPAHGERLCAVRRPWLKSGRRFPCRSAPPAAPRDRSASRSGRRQIAPGKAASSG